MWFVDLNLWIWSCWPTCSEQDDLIIQRQVGEVRDPFGPLHQGKELLVSCLTDICHWVVGLGENKHKNSKNEWMPHLYFPCAARSIQDWVSRRCLSRHTLRRRTSATLWVIPCKEEGEEADKTNSHFVPACGGNTCRELLGEKTTFAERALPFGTFELKRFRTAGGVQETLERLYWHFTDEQVQGSSKRDLVIYAPNVLYGCCGYFWCS